MFINFEKFDNTGVVLRIIEDNCFLLNDSFCMIFDLPCNLILLRHSDGHPSNILQIEVVDEHDGAYQG